MSGHEIETALILSVLEAGFGRERAKVTIENLARNGYTLVPIGEDLMHYKIRAARAERLCDEKDDIIDELR